MQSADLPTRTKMFTLLIAGGVLLSTMDSSMVNVALPAIMRAFELDVIGVKFVVLVYLTVITLTLVFWGRLGDCIGRGKVYLAGMFIFAGGAAGCGVSSGFGWFLVARTLQALGAAMMMANGPAILRAVSPRKHLGKTLGFVGIATSCGLMSGPLLSGMIITFASWRGVFLFSVPLAVLLNIVGYIFLLPALDRCEKPVRRPFDLTGGTIWAAGILLFVAWTSGILPLGGWHLVVPPVLATVVYFFWQVEKRAEAPIMPPVLVGKRYYWTSVATASISFAALFMVLILLPFYLDYVLGYSAGRIGLVMMALPASLVVVSPVSGWIYDNLGSARLISTVGLFVCLMAMIALLLLDEEARFVDCFWRLMLLGAGQSIFLAPNSASVLSRVKDTYAGVTSGILTTARNFGMLTGTALAGTGFGTLYTYFGEGRGVLDYTGDQLDAFLLAMRTTLSVAVLLLLLGCLISWIRGR